MSTQRATSATLRRHADAGCPTPAFRLRHGGDPSRHARAGGAIRPHDDAGRGGQRREAGTGRRARVGLAVRRSDQRVGARSGDGHPSRAGADRQRARRRMRARAADHQRARLLRRSAVRSESRQGLRLSDALHADAATCRPQGRAGRRHAGAEQAGRRLRRLRRGAGRSTRRAMRRRAAAREDDRCLDRRREDAPGAGDGAQHSPRNAPSRCSA